MKYLLGILGAAFLVSLFYLVFIYDKTPSGYILPIPEALLGEKSWVYKRDEADIQAYRTDIGNILQIFDPTDIDTQRIEDYLLANPDSGKESLQSAIESELSKSGYDYHDFIAHTISIADYEEILSTEGFATTETIESLRLYSYQKDGNNVATVVAQILLIKYEGKYFAIVWQFEEFDLNPTKEVQRLEFSYTLDETQIANLSSGYVVCNHTGQKTGYLFSPLETYTCSGTDVSYTLISPSEVNEIKLTKKVYLHLISECSIGSLWQQFACRYLGQSKYDSEGNLKPEAKKELGIE